MAESKSLTVFEEKPQRKTNVAEILPPVDFSFLHLTNLQECDFQEPRDLSPRKYKKYKTKIILEDGEKKYLSRCLRLNNNQLSDVQNLMSQAVTLFNNAANIGWIDLSFNVLQKIDHIFTQFENLKILYLHGNIITDLKEVNKLASLSKLWKLTLHGNEIEKIKGYRSYVLAALPNLVNFDFSTVTKGDVMTAKTWRSFNYSEKPKK